MRSIALLLAAMISLSTYGQDTLNNKQTTAGKKWLIGASFSPDYCFRTLKNNDGAVNTGTNIDQRNGREHPKLGYTAGLNVLYNLSKHIGLEAGVQYSNKGYTEKVDGLYYYPPSPGDPVSLKNIYNNHFIEIPILINYTFGKRKLGFCASAGITTGIFIKETVKSTIKYNDGSTTNNEATTSWDYKKIDLSPTIAVGAIYRINSKMTLKVAPTFKYGILKRIDAPITEYLWNAGLNVSYYIAVR